MARGGGDNAINIRKGNFMKLRRKLRQSFKSSHSQTAHDTITAENLTIVPVTDLVIEATQKKRETLLLKDIPNRDLERKVKLVCAVRPGRIGKNGVMSRPTKINKKKVKKLLKRQNLKSQILKTVDQMDVEMRI